MSFLSKTEQEIHVSVKVHSLNLTWLFSAIYASLRLAERRILWNNLSIVAELQNLPWVMARDFNEPLEDSDKLGGRAVGINRSLEFKECLDRCNMIDLGFSGTRYTWTNKRELMALIQERIDRFFVNPDWCSIFLEVRVSHLTRCHSDHCPVLLCPKPIPFTHLPRPFRFQTCWLSDPSFPKVVSQAWNQAQCLPEAIDKFRKDVQVWNKNHFGNVFGKKRRLLARLNGI